MPSKPRSTPASLGFGAILHLALAQLLRHGDDPVETLKREWKALQQVELRYSRKDSWQGLSDKGEKLLAKLCREEAQKITGVLKSEVAQTKFKDGLD